MLNYVFVGLGAALGGGLRYWVSNVAYKIFPTFFPYGTLLVNVLGSFILGLFIFYFDKNELFGQNLKLFLTIGFCGGFTTFSTFSFETIKMFQDSEIYLGLLNILLSVLLSFLGIYLAYILSKL